MIPFDIPNLDPAERGFQLDDGTLVAVKVASIGAPSHELVAEFTVRGVDAAGATLLVNGLPLVLPIERHTLMVAGIADGKITVEGWLAATSAALVPKVPAYRAGLIAWTKLVPVAPSEPPA